MAITSATSPISTTSSRGWCGVGSHRAIGSAVGRHEPESGQQPRAVSSVQHRSTRPLDLLRYIEVLEDCLGRKAQKVHAAHAAGDVADTFAEVSELIADVGYQPDTPIETGVRNFVDWFLDYYRDAAAVR